MKNTPTLKRCRLSRAQLVCLLTPVVSLVSIARGADISKVNNADNLNLTTSWVGGVLPGSGDVAVFGAELDSTGIPPLDDGTGTLRSYMPFTTAASWGGIRAANAAGMQLAIDSFNAGTPGLTIGSAGIDLSGAAAGTSFQLFGQAFTLGASQTWSVPDGVTLEFAGATATFARSTGAMLKISRGVNSTGIIKPSTAMAAANAILGYATMDSNDFAAANADRSMLVPGNTLGTYVANPYSDATTAAPNVGASATVINVINSGTGFYLNTGVTPNVVTATGTALRFSANIFLTGIRFATPHATGLDWTVDGSGTTRNINIGGGGLVVGPAVGAKNVVFNGASQFRFGTNSDFYIHQFNPSGDLILNNAMNQSTGTGTRLNKSGPGRVILTNNGNSLGGQTTILEGTIQVGNGGTSGTINNGPIANFGTLAFNRTNAFTVANAISGNGAIQMLGNGTMTLTGNSTFTGSLSINAGTVLFGAASNLGASTGPLAISGNSSLQWTGAANNTDISTRTVTIGAGGARLDIGSNNVTFANSIGNSGAGGITKSGTGTLTLAAGNTYAGDTSITAGGLALTNSSGSATGSGNITIAGGSSLTGNGSATGTASIASSATLAPGNAGVGTLTLGGLNLSAASVVDIEFASSDSYDKVVTTDLTINGGGLHLYNTGSTTQYATAGVYDIFQHANPTQGTGASALTVLNPKAGFSYTFADSGSLVSLTIAQDSIISNWSSTGGGSWASVGNWSDGVPTTGYTAQFNANLGAPVTVTLDGSRTVNGLVLDSANSYTIAQGTSGVLIFDKGSSSAAVNILNGSHTVSAPAQLNSTIAVAAAAGSSLTFSEAVNGSGGIVKSGAGLLDLAGHNNIGGPINVVGGVLGFAFADSLGSSLTLNGGTLRYDTGNTADISSTIAIGADGGTVDTNGNDVTFANAFGNNGTGSMTKAGSGTLVLSGANTYTGATGINGGTLSIASNDALGVPATGAAINMNGGTLGTTVSLALDNAGANNRAVTIGSSGGGFNVAESTTLSVSGTMTGSTGTLTKSGNGTLNLSGNSILTLSSPINVVAGTLQAGGTQANGQQGLGTGAITLGNGTTLRTNGAGASDNATSYGTVSNALVVASGNTANLVPAKRVTIASALTGAGTLNVQIDGTRQDYAGNWGAFTGQINLAGAGEFRFANFQSNVFNNSSLNIGAGVTVYQSFNPPSGTATETVQNIGALTGPAGAVIGGNPVAGRFVNWTIGGLNTSTVFAGSIQDTAGSGASRLTKVGNGTLTLSGASTYTASTTVNGGTLEVNGRLGTSPVTVATTGTLAGNGSFGGVITVNGALRPDASGTLGGSMTLDGDASLTLASTATTQFDIKGGVFTGVKSTATGANTLGGAVVFNFLGTIFDGTYKVFDLAVAPTGTFSGVTASSTVTTTPVVLDGTSGSWVATLDGASLSFNPATGELTVTGSSAGSAVTPGASTLSATVGNATANLSWTSASGADTYTVKRAAVAGGPYTNVVSNLVGTSYSDTGLTNGTTYYYVVQAKNSSSGLSGANSNEVSATPLAVAYTSLQNWRFEQFGVYDDTTGVLAGDTEDFDGDGQVNILEYALDTNPKVPNASPVVVAKSGNFLTLTYPRRSVADSALTYTVQVANDLAAPFTAGTGATTNSGASYTYTDNVDVSVAGARRFLRLSVSYATP